MVMIPYDYHIHTAHSHDGEAPMERMIERAVSLGLKEIAFTDHVDWLTDSGALYSAPVDYGPYVKEFNGLQAKYSGKIKLLLGAEIGVAPYTADRVRAFVGSRPFDFIILSSHECCGADLWYDEATFFAGKEKRGVYTAYFEEVLQNIKANDAFSVYGHLDYIRRYGGYGDNSLDCADYREVIDALLRALIEKGKGLELNTSGYRYGLGQTHPQFSILKRYRELGGEIITVGSDAHNTGCVAEHFGLCREMLIEAGFKRITLFRGLEPVFAEL